jgi:hypothetical protein
MDGKKIISEQDWLTAKQVAQFFHIHRNTLKRIPSKDLSFIRINSRGDRRYYIEDIEKFINQRTVK